MPLAFIKQGVKKSSGLRRLLHRQIAGVHPGRPLTRVHASDITYESHPFCARERAYLLRDGKQPPMQRLGTSQSVTFDIGRAVEDIIVEAFVEAGMVVGDWKCRHCGRMHKFCKRPFKCSKEDCGHKHFDHIEQRVLSDITEVSCGLDLLLALPGQNKHTVVEIKSMDKDIFKSLVAPLAEHATRTKLYLRCLAESSQPWTNLVRHDMAYILYTTKGGYGTACEEVPTWDFWDEAFSPFKDYVIERDDASLDQVVEPALQLKAWKEAFENDPDAPLPPRICSSSLDKRAKKCSCLKPCFMSGGQGA